MQKIYKLKSGFKTTLFYWIPKRVDAVMQIVHGSAEHSGRYDAFARYLNTKNIAVYSINLRGHGPLEIQKGRAGFFSNNNGYQKVLKDIDEISGNIKKKYPKKPYYLFGHSMGSFIVRTYVAQFKGVNKLIAMGSAQPSWVKYTAFKVIIKIILLFCKGNKKSKFLNNLSYGSFNIDLKKTKQYKYPSDWISWNQKNRDKFRNDPYCGFAISNKGMLDMITWMIEQQKSININKIQKKLKILLISGADDPVGNFSKEIVKANAQYQAHQIDSKIVIIPNMRHEILNENDKIIVYKEIYKFLSK